MDNLKLWHKFLETVKPVVSSSNYRAFFYASKISVFEEDQITISTPSAFVKQTLSQKHLSLIEASFEQITGKKVAINFIVKEFEAPKQEMIAEDFFQPAVSKPNVLNPKYTLENFVVGPTNNLAFAASQAVAQNPGTSYNPLFIYGGTGVGKTHLMIGVGNALLKKNSRLKIIYCSSEKFMNDYVGAIQEHRMGQLRAKYRNVDILLIDDIQFFSGREGTQEEFFHTFNELQGKNAQMIFTSDRTPHEIAKLEDRLKSRFAGGLMVDMQSPDYDTRVAILKSKCIEKGEDIPEDALRLLASSLDSNIRELEGKLMQLLQKLKLSKLPATIENIAPLIGQSVKKALLHTPKVILGAICSYFELTSKDLNGPNRQKELVLARHIAMYLLSEELGLTVEKIGQMLGGRDHTTVMHGRDRIKGLINTDRDVQRLLVEIKQKIN